MRVLRCFRNPDGHNGRMADRNLSFLRSLVAQLPSRASVVVFGDQKSIGLSLAVSTRGKKLFALGRTDACGTRGPVQFRSNSSPVAGGRPKLKILSPNGFALVGLIALTPLILSGIVAASGVFFVVRKKLHLQALCVRTALTLQENLKRDLEALLKLNPKATRLRTLRLKAEAALKGALATGQPGAIVVARARLRAVVLEQMALNRWQQSLLQVARFRREQARRELVLNVSRHGGSGLRAQTRATGGLAVAALPVDSLTPDYQPTFSFVVEQAQNYSLSADLAPEFFARQLPHDFFCSASLERKDNQWRAKLLAVSRSSKRW